MREYFKCSLDDGASDAEELPAGFYCLSTFLSHARHHKVSALCLLPHFKLCPP